MKYFLRFVVANFIIATVASFFISKSVVIKSGATLDLTDSIICTWISLSLISILIWIIYMFYHWGTSNFQSSKVKAIWFIILLFGTMLYFGPLVYYVVVYEMGKGLKS